MSDSADRKVPHGRFIFGLALLLRIGFVAWAPGVPTGDGEFYGYHAMSIANGTGYTSLDGSPAIQWMPGWPYFIAGIYAVFGEAPRAVMLVNALLGAATAWLVAGISREVADARRAVLAGVLYAVWPGLVYYTATLFTECIYSFLFAATLYALLRSRGAARPGRWMVVASVAFGLGALVKAEPLGFVPVLLLFLWLARDTPARAARDAVILLGTVAILLAPWLARNYQVFGRLMSSANGGMVVWVGNHPGAEGGNDIKAVMKYRKRFDATNLADASLAMNDAGWRDAWEFVRENPAEELRIIGRKLRLTYGGDADGALMIRGFGRDAWHLSETTWRALAWVADLFWFSILALMLAGVSRMRAWPREAKFLLLGAVAIWFGLHLVFLGGSRFHVPEAIVFAVVAAGGVEWLRSEFSPRRAPAEAGDGG